MQECTRIKMETSTKGHFSKVRSMDRIVCIHGWMELRLEAYSRMIQCMMAFSLMPTMESLVLFLVEILYDLNMIF